MNLLADRWLKFRCRDGSVLEAPATAVVRPEIVDVELPRSDFAGAAWQFLIGLLQTVYAPRDLRAWLAAWQTPPTEADLQQALKPFSPAFELFGDGPRFMQDRDPLDHKSPVSVGALLIDAPGEQGIKQNTDHFVKRGVGHALCPACAAHALMTVQTTGPAGGTGYRVGVRGGGPLTTLVLPAEPNDSLWRKLWLNVLTRDQPDLRYPDPAPDDAGIFPWLAATRTSEKNSATPVTTPENMHPLHVYWAMPNRFRLEEPNAAGGECDVCGETVDQLVSGVRVTNYGINYDGPWRHPLTPYRFNPKKPGESPISQKGQQGGLGYRHWEVFTLEDRQEQGNLPATVVTDYQTTKQVLLANLENAPRRPRLWVFGYDMKQNKPRGWYATEMLLVTVEPEARDMFQYLVRQLIQAAERTAYHLRTAVKNAWFGDAGTSGDLDFVPRRFWAATSEVFFTCLPDIASAAQDGAPSVPAEIGNRWFESIHRSAREIFDDYALAGEIEAAALRRVMLERNKLAGKIRNDPKIKPLWESAEKEATT